jgi:RNA polymerase sigma factor (sigma-70 family)
VASNLGQSWGTEEHERLARLAERAARQVGLHNLEDLRDVVINTMARLANTTVNVRDTDRYTKQVARNFARYSMRTFARYEKFIETLEAQASSSSYTIDELLVGFTLREEVRLLLAELPDRQREALEHKYFDDLDNRTIADLMRISEETVKTHLDRGRKAFRLLAQDYFDSYGFEGPKEIDQ